VEYRTSDIGDIQGQAVKIRQSSLRMVFFSEKELATYMKTLSKLNGHPDRNKVPGVEANTGPLGHGLPRLATARVLICDGLAAVGDGGWA
jgi:transketolase N-terminal domain/subunit